MWELIGWIPSLLPCFKAFCFKVFDMLFDTGHRKIMSWNDLTEGDKTNSPTDSETRFETLMDVCTLYRGPPTLYYTKNKDEVSMPSLTFGCSDTIKSRR